MLNINNLSKKISYVDGATDEFFTFDLASGALITSASGLDGVSVDLTQETGIDDVGTVVLGASVQSRPITLSGVIVGDDQMQSKERLYHVFSPGKSGRLYVGDWHIEVYATSTPAIERSRRYANFTVSLLAPYPYFTGSLPITQTFGGGLVDFYNPSPVPVPFALELTLSGPVTFLTLHYADDNGIIEYLRPILSIPSKLTSARKYYFESTHTGVSLAYVQSPDTEKWRYNEALSTDSTFFRLPAGLSEMELSASSGVDNVSATITFFEERAGVIL